MRQAERARRDEARRDGEKMDQRLYEPAKNFNSVFSEFCANCDEFFDKLANESGIDIEQNKRTVASFDAERKTAGDLGKKLKKLKTIKTLLSIVTAIGIALAVFALLAFIGEFATKGAIFISVGAALIAAAQLIQRLKIAKDMKSTEETKKRHDKKAGELFSEALGQMSSLNALFNDTDTFELISKTVPELVFDRTLTKDQERNLVENYDFECALGADASVQDLLSGRLRGNPFLFLRYMEQTMGTERYTGTLTIFWTEETVDKDGNAHTISRSQTLTASVTKPIPQYLTRTFLEFGHQAAPNLCFSRFASHIDDLSDKQIERKVESGQRKLRRKGRETIASGDSFQKMANDEFDVLFGATNRNDEVGFRVLFTPLAQKNMVALLKDRENYGDDFSFIKHKRDNTISSEHMQTWRMSVSARQYRSHSFALTEKIFKESNKAYFKSVFFDFAPLMSVPAYLEEPSFSLQPVAEYRMNYPKFEHESMANALGASAFAPDDAATDTILKTEFAEKSDDIDAIRVVAHSFRAIPQVDYVPVLGGDGNYHDVPVPWTEYVPTQRESDCCVRDLKTTERDFEKDEASAELGTCAFRRGMIASLKKLF